MRSLKIGLYTFIVCLVATAVAVLVNALASALPSDAMKHDVSAQKLYELSPATEKLLSSLDEDVTLYLVVEEGKENVVVSNLLEKYASLGERVGFERVDPVLHPTLTAPDGESVDLSALDENSVIVAGSGRTRTVDYSELFKTEFTDEEYENYYYYGVTPTGSTSFCGEAKLTGAITYVAGDEVPRVYTLTGHGEYELGSTMAGYLKDDNYDVEQLSLVAAGSVPDDADCVVIFYPQRDLSEAELAALGEYVDGGGKVLLLTGYLPSGMSSLANLCSLGAQNGLSVVDGLVVEGSSSNYMSGYPYYILPEVQSHAITGALDSNTFVLLTAAHGLAVSDAAPDGVTVETLLTTTDSAFVTDGESIDETDAVYSGRVVLGAVAQNNKGGALVWYSSPSLGDDQTDLYVSGGNSTLLLSTFNTLCDNEGGVSIEAKSMEVDSLTVSGAIATFWTVVLTVVVPLVIVAAGLVFWIIRRKR